MVAAGGVLVCGGGERRVYFQFGGSTYCLVFRPGVVTDFALQAIPQPENPAASLVRVCSKVAIAASP